MPITTLPTRTEGAGTHEFGQTKLEDGTYTDATKQVKAAFWNRVLDYLIDLATEVGKTDGTTPGSLRADKANKTLTLTAGTGLTGGGDLSANRTFSVDFGEAGDIQAVGSANAAGASGEVADAAHVHAHGDQVGGSLHALVTADAHGFLEKEKFDGALGKGKNWHQVWYETFKGVIHNKLFGTASGTGAVFSGSATASGFLGVGILNTGTSTSGYSRLYSYLNWLYDSPALFLEIELVAYIVDALPDGTDDYTLRLCGVGLPTGSETGWALVLDRTAPVNPGNWQIARYSGGAVVAWHDTGIAAATTTRFRVRMRWDRAADTVQYFIDGANAGTLGSMPAPSADYLYVGEIRKIAGTNQRRLWMEFTKAEVQYTSARPG